VGRKSPAASSLQSTDRDRRTVRGGLLGPPICRGSRLFHSPHGTTTLAQWAETQSGFRRCGYGSEENYAYLETNQIDNYLKYNTFYQDTHPPRKAERIQALSFRSENFPYDADQDTFTCPAQHSLTYQETRSYRSKNGYLSERRNYECAECATCPLKPQCHKAKGNRRIQVSLKTPRISSTGQREPAFRTGIALRKQRCIEPETTFGMSNTTWAFEDSTCAAWRRSKQSGLCVLCP